MYAVDTAGFNYEVMSFEEVSERYSLNPTQKHLIKTWTTITIDLVITIYRVK